MAKTMQETKKEIQQLMAQKSLTLGADSVLKGLRQSKIHKVFLASNCPDGTTKTISHYCSIQKVEMERISIDSSALGIVCKKPFSISVLGVKA